MLWSSSHISITTYITYYIILIQFSLSVYLKYFPTLVEKIRVIFTTLKAFILYHTNYWLKLSHFGTSIIFEDLSNDTSHAYVFFYYVFVFSSLIYQHLWLSNMTFMARVFFVVISLHNTCLAVHRIHLPSKFHLNCSATVL